MSRHGVTTNNPVMGQTRISLRVAASKPISRTIVAFNPPQRLARQLLSERSLGSSCKSLRNSEKSCFKIGDPLLYPAELRLSMSTPQSWPGR